MASAGKDEAAPDNPYLHESRNLREEDGDFEIALPASLRDDPALLAEMETAGEPTRGEPVEDGQGESEPSEEKAKTVEQAAPAKGHANGRLNGHDHGNGNNGKRNGNTPGQNGQNSLSANGKRTLQIIFRPSGDLDRDKYRLKQIVDMVRDPKGRDQFLVVVKSSGKSTTLAFPDDPCSISDRLRNDLSKFFRVEVQVVEVQVKE
jgi:hypothetical protein